MTIPKTSVALLRAISEDTDSRRWNDFYERYCPVMQAYLKAAFPSVDQDDVIQETMITFMQKAKNYIYDPEQKGLFHNYLIGILKFKAIDALRARTKEAAQRDKYGEEATSEEVESRPFENNEVESWRQTVCKMALRELMNDKSITTQNKEIFRRVAVQGESIVHVAESFGVSRNNVDQIKARLTKKLKDIIDDMGNIDGPVR